MRVSITVSQAFAWEGTAHTWYFRAEDALMFLTEPPMANVELGDFQGEFLHNVLLVLSSCLFLLSETVTFRYFVLCGTVPIERTRFPCDFTHMP